MLADLDRSTLPVGERQAVLVEISLPRVLLQQRYLASIVDAGPGAGGAALRRLSALLADPLVTGLDPADLKKGLTTAHLTVVADADWPGLRELLRQPEVTPATAKAPAPPVGRLARWRDRGRHVADLALGRARHRRLLEELGALRRSVNQLQKAQQRVEEELRSGREKDARG
jgi:hypothetical protein